MSSLKDKERSKEQQEKFQAILSALLKDEDNKYCVDCDAKGPRWASWNLGIFLCIRCAGIHRNLGVHISKVKSVNLDSWTAEQVAMMQEMGNSRARAVYEANIPDGFRRPQTDSALEAFIRSKYEHKKYIAREWIPPQPKVPKESNSSAWLEDNKEKKKPRAKPAGGVQLPSIPKVSDKSSDSSKVASSKPEPVKVEPAQPASASNDLLGLDIGPPLQTNVQQAAAPVTSQSNELLEIFGAPQPAGGKPPSASNDLIGNTQQNGAAPDSGDLFAANGAGGEEKKTSAKDSIMALFGGSGGSGMAPQPQMYGVPGPGMGYYSYQGYASQAGMAMNATSMAPNIATSMPSTNGTAGQNPVQNVSQVQSSASAMPHAMAYSAQAAMMGVGGMPSFSQPAMLYASSTAGLPSYGGQSQPVQSAQYQPVQSAQYQPVQSAQYQPVQSAQYQPVQSAQYQPVQSAQYQPVQSAQYQPYYPTQTPTSPKSPLQAENFMEKLGISSKPGKTFTATTQPKTSVNWTPNKQFGAQGGVYMPQGQQQTYPNQGMMGQPQGMMGQPQGMMGQPQGMMGQSQGFMGQPQGMMGQMGQPQGMMGQPQGMMMGGQGMVGQQMGMMRPPAQQGMMGQQAINGPQPGMFGSQMGANTGMYNPQQMQQLQFQQMQQQMTNMKLGSAQMGAVPQQAIPGAQANSWGAQTSGHTLSNNLWQ